MLTLTLSIWVEIYLNLSSLTMILDHGFKGVVFRKCEQTTTGTLLWGIKTERASYIKLFFLLDTHANRQYFLAFNLRSGDSVINRKRVKRTYSCTYNALYPMKELILF